MIHEKCITIDFQEIDTSADLSITEQKLLDQAVEAAKTAYSPYSKFSVGASVLLENGETILGSNQENAAYPSGLCAERVALFSASANFPNVKRKIVAIFAQDSNEDEPISPCGSCRQVMSEYEILQESNMVVLLMNAKGKIWRFSDCSSLLPIAFKPDSLKKH